MEHHYAPFFDVLPEGHKVESHLVDAGEGHVPPKRALLGKILKDVVGS